jgi:hypothetical protein
MSQLGGIALGWIDAIAELKKGSKATIYIPSSLGYGKGGNPQAGINPDAILVFDMNIVDVISEEVAMAKQQAMQQQQMQQQQMQQQQMQAQQKMMEEAQKAAPKK